MDSGQLMLKMSMTWPGRSKNNYFLQIPFNSKDAYLDWTTPEGLQKSWHCVGIGLDPGNLGLWDVKYSTLNCDWTKTNNQHNFLSIWLS